MSLRALRGEKSEKLMPRMQNTNVSSKLQAYRETNLMVRLIFQSQSILPEFRRLKSGIEKKNNVRDNRVFYAFLFTTGVLGANHLLISSQFIAQSSFFDRNRYGNSSDECPSVC